MFWQHKAVAEVQKGILYQGVLCNAEGLLIYALLLQMFALCSSHMLSKLSWRRCISNHCGCPFHTLCLEGAHAAFFHTIPIMTITSSIFIIEAFQSFQDKCHYQEHHETPAANEMSGSMPKMSNNWVSLLSISILCLCIFSLGETVIHREIMVYVCRMPML